ncbi:MAG: hypothetical protein DRJ15_05015, partial [Bacteroidetes bacterium]
TLPGIQMAYRKISYGVGHGNSASIHYIDCLNEGEQVNMLNGWFTEGILWQSFPGESFTPPNSDWYFASSTHYLALKLGERRYGWIELDTSDPEQGPVFIRIAIN